MFWPASPWNATRLPSTPFGGYGFGDPVGLTWALSWFTFALEHGLNIFHRDYLDFPGGANVINGAPLLGLLATPITLTLGPFAAFNVLLRIAFASSAGSISSSYETGADGPQPSSEVCCTDSAPT